MYYRVNEYQVETEDTYDVTVEQMYKVFKEKLFASDSILLDKGEYQFKYFILVGFQ